MHSSFVAKMKKWAASALIGSVLLYVLSYVLLFVHLPYSVASAPFIAAFVVVGVAIGFLQAGQAYFLMYDKDPKSQFVVGKNNKQHEEE
jgi:hypothetical protein